MAIRLFQKKKAAPAPEPAVKANAIEGEDLAPDAVVQLEDGTEVTLAALMEAYKASKAPEAPAAAEPAAEAPASAIDQRIQDILGQ